MITYTLWYKDSNGESVNYREPLSLEQATLARSVLETVLGKDTVAFAPHSDGLPDIAISGRDRTRQGFWMDAWLASSFVTNSYDHEARTALADIALEAFDARFTNR